MRALFLRAKQATNKKKTQAERRFDLDIDGQNIAVIVKHHARARRFTLKFNPAKADFSLTIPKRASFSAAQKFAQSQTIWMKKQFATAHIAIPFAHGAIIPIRGIDHVICHEDKARGTVRIENDDGLNHKLFVTGHEPHIARRIADWLKTEARSDLKKSVDAHASQMDLSYGRITIRDPKTRWGSCSSNQTLSFSWRLILAPDFVLDYVAAHEVAHLKHMNHSAQYWALVKAHCPQTEEAKTWLKKQGTMLLRYGI